MGSSPIRVATFPGRIRWLCWEELRAGVAQLAEQLICNQQVAGSSPIASSTLWVKRELHMGRFPSGQREQTVNLPRHASVVRIHPCPPSSAGMAELADAHDSGSCVQYALAGSSPVSRTFGALVNQGLRSFLYLKYPYRTLTSFLAIKSLSHFQLHFSNFRSVSGKA